MEQKGVAAVFDYIKATMPADDPSSLEDDEYTDILAYLIQANGFPAGARELTAADLPRVRVRRAPHISLKWPKNGQISIEPRVFVSHDFSVKLCQELTDGRPHVCSDDVSHSFS